MPSLEIGLGQQLSSGEPWLTNEPQHISRVVHGLLFQFQLMRRTLLKLKKYNTIGPQTYVEVENGPHA